MVSSVRWGIQGWEISSPVMNPETINPPFKTHFFETSRCEDVQPTGGNPVSRQPARSPPPFR
jgi:hypothetical protein